MRFTLRKTLALLATLTLATHAFAIDDAIIPQASYYVMYKNLNTYRYATFFTFDGNPITAIAIDNYINSSAMDSKLDPSAPKPQPVTYTIKHPRKILLGSSSGRIYFYDKSNNIIKSYEYDKNSIIVYPRVKRGHLEKFPTRHIYVFHNTDELKEHTTFFLFPLDLSCVSEKK